MRVIAAMCCILQVLPTCLDLLVPFATKKQVQRVQHMVQTRLNDLHVACMLSCITFAPLAALPVAAAIPMVPVLCRLIVGMWTYFEAGTSRSGMVCYIFVACVGVYVLKLSFVHVAQALARAYAA